ncbi:unnamed protein product [Prunus armeniaca]
MSTGAVGKYGQLEQLGAAKRGMLHQPKGRTKLHSINKELHTPSRGYRESDTHIHFIHYSHTHIQIHHKERRELGAVLGTTLLPASSSLLFYPIYAQQVFSAVAEEPFLYLVVISIKSTELSSLECACPNLTRSKVYLSHFHQELLLFKQDGRDSEQQQLKEVVRLLSNLENPCVSFPFPKSPINLRASSILNSQLTGFSLKVKFFPAQKTNKSRKEILGFTQKEGEAFHECWERYKEMISSCPHHNIESWMQMQSFYEGLLDSERMMVDATSGEGLMNKIVDDGFTLFESLSANSQQWSYNKGRGAPMKAVVSEVSTNNEIVAKLDVMCSLLQQAVTGPLGNKVEGWRNHPNFKWRNNSNVQQSQGPPPGFQIQQRQFQQAPQRVQEQRVNKLEVQVRQIASSLSNRASGTFPSQTEVNSRHQEHANAVHILRSGKQVDNEVGDANEEQEDGENVEIIQPPHGQPTAYNKQSLNASGKSTGPKVSSNANQVPISTNTFRPIAPFPSRLSKSKKDQSLDEIMETFKKVQINIPLLNVIAQIPKYAKFLKDLCTNKRRFKEHEQVALSEEVSAVLQRKLPPKLKDPVSFSKFQKALLDLGASINLMPYHVYEKLNLGELQATIVSIQLADRTIRYPKGILEDVLVNVEGLILPVDFLVLEMEEAPIPDN